MFGMLLGLLSGRARRIIGFVLAVVAVLVFAGAVLAMVTDINLRANGVKTNATVIKVTRQFARHSSAASYTDLIAFTTADGKRYQESIDGSRSTHVGDTLTVVYDPSDPSIMEAASSLSGLWWVTPVVLALFAILAGWLSWRLLRRRSASPQEAMFNEF